MLVQSQGMGDSNVLDIIYAATSGMDALSPSVVDWIILAMVILLFNLGGKGQEVLKTMMGAVSRSMK